MNRYSVVEETVKNGRKKEINYAIYDKHESKVVYRGSEKINVEFICDQMNDRYAEVSGS
jgi:tmRNA-binding protein